MQLALGIKELDDDRNNDGTYRRLEGFDAMVAASEDLLDKKDKSVFGLLFSVILKFVKLEDEDAEAAGGDVREALKLWFSKRTAGYKGVSITDLKSSFTDGLVLCALIHKLRPRLIPYDTMAGGKV